MEAYQAHYHLRIYDIMEALTLADRIAVMNVGPGPTSATSSRSIGRDRAVRPIPSFGQLFAELENMLHGDH